jgi:hypothetical protein
LGLAPRAWLTKKYKTLHPCRDGLSVLDRLAR